VLAEVEGGARRRLTLRVADAADPSAVHRMRRVAEVHTFLTAELGRDSFRSASIRYLQGDASPRAYARIVPVAGKPVILMDQPRMPDGPPVRDGLPYSRIAHLAEDIGPFVAIAAALEAGGLSVPHIVACDLELGLALIEDFGDGVFGALVHAGGEQRELWRAGVDALVALRGLPADVDLPLANGRVHRLQRFDRRAMAIETELVPDWLWPMIKGAPAPADAIAAYRRAFDPVIERLIALPAGWLLRDYHSPNLMWLPERTGAARVGLLDFQDTMLGHPAYDLVSLLQDARVDVAPTLEQDLFNYYVSEAARRDPNFDANQLAFAYAAFSCQRNSKILGIFARLSQRDGKHHYLAHLPRVWRYLERSLSHPELAVLKSWYDTHWPPALRGVPPAPGR
jgi:N-acetylmuramate 1-kinase